MFEVLKDLRAQLELQVQQVLWDRLEPQEFAEIRDLMEITDPLGLLVPRDLMV